MLAFHFSAFTGALLIGWIFSVCVHEFAHALAAYFGGDRSEQTRAYLKFNPLDYIDPVTSLLLPSVLLLMGGVPFPGGAVRIDRRLLRNRHWRAAVSAAGPASNILLFAILTAVLHPAVGIVEPEAATRANWERFLGALAVLQLVAVFGLLCWVSAVSKPFWGMIMEITERVGLDWDLLWGSYNLAFFGTR